LPGGKVPELFNHNIGPSISLWFRNSLPTVAVSFVFPPAELYPILVTINGEIVFIEHTIGGRLPQPMKLDHLYLLVLQLEMLKLETLLLENEWNHMVVRMLEEPQYIKGGIHVFNEKSSMGDIRFTDPCWESKSELNLSPFPRKRRGFKLRPRFRLQLLLQSPQKMAGKCD